MIALITLHFVVAAALVAVARRLGRKVFLLGTLPSVVTLVWAGFQYGAVSAERPVTQSYRWIPSIGMELSFILDALSWWMLLVISGVGVAVLVFCAYYFDDDEVGLGRFAGCLVAFAGAMVGLVTADDLLMVVVFWELTSILSYLLIGHRSGAAASRAAATQALVVTTLGGLAMMVGVIALGLAAGTTRLSELLGGAPLGAPMGVITALILAGAFTKSAQVPFHFWLPGAMAAPTPASAYLHAAAMVKAGIYLIARMAPLLADQPVWRYAVVGAGTLSMLMGGYRALRQFDLKLILAYGTVSQLGLLTLVAGAGTADTALAAVTMLVAHALFKACLFLTTGAIDHAMGTRDIRVLHGGWRRMPVLGVTAAVALASMSGLPLTLGFVAKEAAIDAFWFSTRAGDRFVLAVIVVGSMLTVAYSVRFFLGAFTSRPGRFGSVVPTDEAATDEPVPPHGHLPNWAGLLPPVLLGFLGLVGALLSPWMEGTILFYADAWTADSHPVHLALWHGFTPALALSALALAGGLLLVWAAAPVERFQAWVVEVPSADGVYRAAMTGLGRLAVEVTGGLQRGSVPFTLAIIVGVFIALPGGSMLLGGVWPQGHTMRWWDRPAQVGIVALITVAAVAATRSRRRLRAAILVGVTGYGTAMMFLLHGAPDVALTQVLAETVSLVLVILVQRRLPIRFTDQPPGLARLWRWAVAIPAGVATMALAVVAAGARPDGVQPASFNFEYLAQQFGGGKNVVSVTLVDIRAWDTMGEISVLLAAAVGVSSLVFLRQKNLVRARSRTKAVRDKRAYHAAILHPEKGRSFMSEGPQTGVERSGVIFEVVTRLGFHFMIMYSLYLLFAGHNAPGGGFTGGLVVGLALTIRYLAGGRSELAAALPVMPGWVLGLGLAMAVGAGLAPLPFGGAVLQSYVFDFHLPVIGAAHLVTSIFFDIGVYLVVIGLMLDVLRALGGGLDVIAEEEEAREAARAEGVGAQ